MARPITSVHIAPDFEKAYLRLPKHIQILATRKDQWFRNDAFDPRLRTDKLKGDLSAYWPRSTASIVYYFGFSVRAKSSITM
jgi:hypothetical protein